MDFSPPFAALITSPSPDGALLATVTASPSPTPTSSTRRTITVRSLASLKIVAQWADLPRVGLPANGRPVSLRWACPVLRPSATAKQGTTPDRNVATGLRCHRRLLYADERGVIVLDVLNSDWKAVLANGSGGMGKIVFADFATDSAGLPIGPPPLTATAISPSSGHTGGPGCGTEVVTFYEFGSQALIFFVDGPMEGRSVVVRDPRIGAVPWQTIAFRNRTQVVDSQHQPGCRDRTMAVLSRQGAHDMLTLHSGLARAEYGIIASAVLPTVDAQAIKWSRCGNWIAVWDSPSFGCVVHVYTALAELYRTYDTSAEGVTVERCDGGVTLPKLGIRTVEWSPVGDYLAIATYDRRVVLLSTKTFSPVVFLDHTPAVDIDPHPVWVEQPDAPGTYSEGSQPMAVPTTPGSGTSSDGLPKNGIVRLSFSARGGLLATVSAAHPNTVWIWDMRRLVARTVIVQRGAVKSVRWHPSLEGVLLLCCVPVAGEDSVLYLWEASWLDQDKKTEKSDGVETGQDEAAEQTPEDATPANKPQQDETKDSVDTPPVLVSLSREFCLSRTGPGSGTGMNRLDVSWLDTSSGRKTGLVVATCPLGCAPVPVLTTADAPATAPLSSQSALPAPGKAMVVWPGGRDPILRLDYDERMLFGAVSEASAKTGTGRGMVRNGVADDVDDSVFDILTQRLDNVGFDPAEGGSRPEVGRHSDPEGDGDDGDGQTEYTEYEYDDDVDGDSADGDGADAGSSPEHTETAPFFPHDSVEHCDDDDEAGSEDGTATWGNTRTVTATGVMTTTGRPLHTPVDAEAENPFARIEIRATPMRGIGGETAGKGEPSGRVGSGATRTRARDRIDGRDLTPVRSAANRRRVVGPAAGPGTGTGRGMFVGIGAGAAARAVDGHPKPQSGISPIRGTRLRPWSRGSSATTGSGETIGGGGGDARPGSGPGSRPGTAPTHENRRIRPTARTGLVPRGRTDDAAGPHWR